MIYTQSIYKTAPIFTLTQLTTGDKFVLWQKLNYAKDPHIFTKLSETEVQDNSTKKNNKETFNN